MVRTHDPVALHFTPKAQVCAKMRAKCPQHTYFIVVFATESNQLLAKCRDSKNRSSLDLVCVCVCVGVRLCGFVCM